MSQTVDFETRLRRLNKTHAKMYAKGIVRKMGKDGLISAYPRRRMPRFPLKSFLLLMGVAFVYKATLLAWLGAADYQVRVDTLAAGTVLERGGAWMMQVDPATDFLSTQIARILPTV